MSLRLDCQTIKDVDDIARRRRLHRAAVLEMWIREGLAKEQAA